MRNICKLWNMFEGDECYGEIKTEQGEGEGEGQGKALLTRGHLSKALKEVKE